MLLITAVVVTAVSAEDPLARLRDDPSAAASERLSRLYGSTTSPDQRFWLIQALGSRLREHGDSVSLETLLGAADDPDPAVRGPALRALAGFPSIPEEEVRDAWLARLEAVAGRGAGHAAPPVRQGAAELRRTIELWKSPAAREAPLPAVKEAAKARAEAPAVGWLRWLWVLSLPGLLLAWVWMGLPVFDAGVEEGRFAGAVWEVFCRQYLLAGVAVLAWLCFGIVLADWGFNALIRLIGGPGLEPGCFEALDYLMAGLCFFGPGALFAAWAARGPRHGLAGGLERLPWILVLSAVVFAVFLPSELVYRLLLRRARRGAGSRERGLFSWVLETGSLRAGHLASAVMAREGHGLLPALRRVRDLFPEGVRERVPLWLGCFDLRFGALCAAPVFAAMCVLVANILPVHWEAPWPVVFLGCAIWSWTVLGGMLLAVLQTFRGVAAAAGYLAAVGAPEGERVSGLEPYLVNVQ